jgi:hypothetical protein
MEQNHAILIGINDYSHPDPAYKIKSLSGAHDDVDAYDNWLQENGILPAKNIIRLTTRENDLSPTYDNIRKTLDEVKAKTKITTELAAKPFIFIHFSGHGSSRKTVLECRKAKEEMDGILIFKRGYMRDFEFGHILDELAHERAVFVTLDCCFAGGQDRDEDDEDGLTTRVVLPASTPLVEHEIDAALLEKLEKETVSWWDRPRNYTLLAASRENQKASEESKGDHTHGLLTYWTLRALQRFYNKKGPITYHQLFSSISMSMEHDMSKKSNKQDPELLGQCNRLLFREDCLSPSKFAFVSRVIRDKVLINFGKAHCVAAGAEYYIFSHSFNANLGLSQQTLGIVTVTRVGGLRALATLPTDLNGSNISPGCLLMLARPGHVTDVAIQDDGGGNEKVLQSLESLQQTLQTDCGCADHRARLVHRSDLDGSKPALRVCPTNGSYHILDANSQSFPHLQPVDAESDGAVEKVHGLLHDLDHLLRFRNLKNDQSGMDSLFSFRRVGDFASGDVKHNSVFELEIANNSKGPLYYSLLNLDPSGEIRQLYPKQGLGVRVIAQGSPPIKKRIRALLPNDRPDISKSPDVYKLFVSARPSFFGMHKRQNIWPRTFIVTLWRMVCAEIR